MRLLTDKPKFKLVLVVFLALLSACTHVHHRAYEVASQSNISSDKVFEELQRFFAEKGLVQVQGGVDKNATKVLHYQLRTNQGAMLPTAPSDYLSLRLLGDGFVELELTRITSGANFSEEFLVHFKSSIEEALERRLGYKVFLKLKTSQ